MLTGQKATSGTVVVVIVVVTVDVVVVVVVVVVMIVVCIGISHNEPLYWLNIYFELY